MSDIAAVPPVPAAEVAPDPGFQLTRSGPIARITLSRPQKRNALNAAFWHALPDTVRRLSDEGGVRCLIVEAQGPHFTAGMDLANFADGGLSTATPHAREAFHRSALALQDTFTAFERARFPVIAAVQGYCLGAGVDLITACDIRIASADAVFRVEETNIAMMADVGTLQRLARIVGEGLAREMALTGDDVKAARAERIGLVNAVEPDAASARAYALAMAQRIAEKAPLAVAGTKASLNYARDHGVEDALAYAMTLQASIWSPAETLEAFAARAEGRPARYEDLPAVGVFARSDGKPKP